MFRTITSIAAGIFFLLSAAVIASAGNGKGPGTANGQQVFSTTRSQNQQQLQINKNCDGPQIKTQTRKRTNYLK